MKDIDEFYTTKPREQTGRDTFARYKAQVRAAGLAALEILEGGEVDRVYCDYHDDFVVRKKYNGTYQYKFFQVKTRAKASQNWKLNEIFGLKTQKKHQLDQKTEDVKNSYAGKLLQHTVTFSRSCDQVVFMTNAHLDDVVEKMSESMAEHDTRNIYVKFLAENFNECFMTSSDAKLTESEIHKRIAKFRFEVDVQCIKEKNNSFESDARTRIYRFSEIDLEFNETKQILVSLLELISKKSSGIITNFSEAVIDSQASIDINDLLSLLSISREAYKSLVAGGDVHAIKSASVIQRTMSASGASSEEIEYSSKCKTDWDVWLRDNRNMLSDFDLLSITSKIDTLLSTMLGNGKSLKLGELHPMLKQLMAELIESDLAFDITPPLLLGGFISALVRYKA